MSKRIASIILISLSLLVIAGTAQALDTISEYIREYPNQEQAKMMNAWLKKHEKGTFNFTGLVDPNDADH